MAKYFECNLPRSIPTYYTPETHVKLQECVDRVYARTDKLNAACDFMANNHGMRQATFHKLAKTVFDLSADRFDSMSVDELCSVVTLLYNGEEAPDRMEWPNVVVLYDTAFVSVKDWEALRHFGIGGSDSSVLMGVSPYQSEEGLWYDKVGYPVLVEEPGRQAIFDRGHFLEPKVIEVFCDLTGAEVIPETRMFQSKKYPHSTANLDAVLRMASGNIAIFEAKSATDCFTKIEEWLGTNIPANYVTQIHQYLAVMDDPRLEGAYIGMLPCKDIVIDETYVGSDYDTSRYFHHFEPRNEPYEQTILEAEDAFWKNYVETGKKPDPSLNSKVDKEVRKKYTPSPLSDPTIAPKTLQYSAYEDVCQRLDEVNNQVSTMEKQLENVKELRDALRGELIDAMEGSQEATMVDANGEPVLIVKNSRIERVTIDTELLKIISSDVYERCKKATVFTRFSTKQPKKPKK